MDERAHLKISERIFSFGQIGFADSVSRGIWLWNTGTQPLYIDEVRTPCGCTTTSIDSATIEPHDSLLMTLMFDATGFGAGPVEKTIEIYINSQATLADSITFTAQIQRVHDDDITLNGFYSSPCNGCHVLRGKDKYSGALFDADCIMCHTTNPYSKTPHLGMLISNAKNDSVLYQQIAFGKPENGMPAFASANGGPLSSEQIESLVRYFRERN